MVFECLDNLLCFSLSSRTSGVRQTQTADLQTADLQTCRLADLKICRPTFFVSGLWANFIHPLFTVGESQSMSEANNSGLQTQQCPIRQMSGNPYRERLNIGDLNFSESSEEEDGWDHRATVYIKLSLRSRRRKGF